MFTDKVFIGKKIREYRKKLKLSQEYVAEKANISEKHYGRLERGSCTPTLENFFSIIKS